MATVPAQNGGWSTAEKGGIRRRTWIKVAAALAVGGGAAWGFWGGEPVAETGAVNSAVTHVASVDGKVEGDAAIKLCREMLATANQRMSGVQSISAVFQKQERINEKLQPLNVMDVKVRRQPLGIYMQWQLPDAGQQVIWLDGAHDGKMLVSPAGWKRKVVPTVKLAPDDDLAKAVSRRPVTNIGIWNFANRLAALFEEELLKDPAVAVAMTKGHVISGRPCTLFTFEHAKPSHVTLFKQVQIFFDEQLQTPIACEHYRWTDAEGKESHLEESYLYKDLVLNAAVSDADFDHANPALKFGVMK
ncbi:MAG: DUF1571 domain-containing protein [Pirellulales bacterium]